MERPISSILKEPVENSRAQIKDSAAYEEVFDRTQRTFSATFSKFKDLTYFTPVQRIGAYMDFNARLKKTHLMDLIAYVKVSTQPVHPRSAEEDTLDNEEAMAEYM